MINRLALLFCAAWTCIGMVAVAQVAGFRPPSTAVLTIFECEEKGCTPGAPGKPVWTFNDLVGKGRFGSGDEQVTLEHLDAESLAVRRQDRSGFSALYLGKITGNRITGSVTYYGGGHPSTSMWFGVMQGSVESLRQALAAKQSRPPSTAVLTIIECEEKGCTPGAPGKPVWTFNDLVGKGRFGSGDEQVTLEHLDAESLAVRRQDRSGFSALYLGKIAGNRITGSVTYYGDVPKAFHPSTSMWFGVMQGSGESLRQALAAKQSRPGVLPQRIVECEANDCSEESTYPILWTFTGSSGQGLFLPKKEIPTANQVLRIQHFDGTFITVRRDVVAGSGKNQVLIYLGEVKGKHIEGSATSYTPEHPEGTGTETWSGEIEDPRAFVPEMIAKNQASPGIPADLVVCTSSGCGVSWSFTGIKGVAFEIGKTGKQADLTVESSSSESVIVRSVGVADAALSGVYKGQMDGNRIRGNFFGNESGDLASNPFVATAFSTTCARTDGLTLGIMEALDVGRAAYRFKRPPQALDCFLIAAKNGNAGAQIEVAAIYNRGYEPQIKRDPTKAFFWLSKAAAQGNYHAELFLADFYRNGQGIAADPDKAAYWTTQASGTSQGVALARTRQANAQAKAQNDAVNLLGGLILGAMLGDDKPETDSEEQHRRCVEYHNNPHPRYPPGQDPDDPCYAH